VDGISQNFFVQRRKDLFRQRRLDFVAIFIGSRDIRNFLYSTQN